jgi:hypothetical protein
MLFIARRDFNKFVSRLEAARDARIAEEPDQCSAIEKAFHQILSKVCEALNREQHQPLH